LATATAQRDQRRLGREQRRDRIVGSGEQSAASPLTGNSGSEGKTAGDPVRDRLRQPPPSVAAALVGAAAGLLIGVVVGHKTRNRGNEISGDVAVYLLKRIELLTIKLQARQARRPRSDGRSSRESAARTRSPA
jgi:hypothetical protein